MKLTNKIKWKLWCLCAQRLSELREDLAAKKEIKIEKKYCVPFQVKVRIQQSSHHQLRPKIAFKLVKMVQSGTV